MNEDSNYNHVLGDMSHLGGHIYVGYEFDTDLRKLPIALCIRRVYPRLTQIKHLLLCAAYFRQGTKCG